MPTDTHDQPMILLRGLLYRWAALLLALAVFAAWSTCRLSAATQRLAALQASTLRPTTAEPNQTLWTCSMHDQVRAPQPGDCPICGMSLVPLAAGDATAVHAHGRGAHTQAPSGRTWYRCTMPECGDQGSPDSDSRCPVCGMKRERVDTGPESGEATEITLGARAQRLAEVRTEIASPRLLFKQIRAVGRVGFDETRFKMASAWMDGRIEKLFADYTGMMVNRGDHLVAIYSPHLVSAQEEYLQAVRAHAPRNNAPDSVARRAGEQVLRAARRKLELLGVTPTQLEAIEQSGEPETHLVVHAPIGGTIIEKRVMEGMYVKTGDTLYTIADLTHLWLLVNLYEDDLSWVKPFQQVRVTTRSLPGEVFAGQIVFVDPSVDPRTRTIPCRIHVANPSLQLKPDMWVNAIIDAALTTGGQGAIPARQEAYACPMHPWEAGDSTGTCAVCAMRLVRVEDLPQYAPPTEPIPILAVPRDAVMQTGERSLVYVESTPGNYRGVEVTPGPLAHDGQGQSYYPILAGLLGGELVVTRGNFAIDSQMQLAGKPSLFTARGFLDDPPSATADPDAATTQTRCPVMGGEIDPEVYTDLAGVRIYFCCPPCVDRFVANPGAYLDALPTGLAARLRVALEEQGKP